MEIYEKLRPLLFKIDAEKAHNLAQKVLRYTRMLPFGDDILLKTGGFESERLAQKVCGMEFYNPIGLAAGFDKDAQNVKSLCALGFGFLELGTVTKIPQSGNPKPRLFRHTEEQSLQNAMGFNNLGSAALNAKLKPQYPFCIPLGVNIGKNKEITEDDALLNYQKTLEDVLEVGDYYTFNVSSPNTPKLRDLQNEKFVESLCKMARKLTKKPIFLKISPDMHTDDMLSVCEKAIDSGISGIIATNTTIDYSMIAHPKDGGISGAGLREKSKEVFGELAKAFFKKTTLISVGGIFDANDAYSRIKMGASLIQLYTGLVYKGPGICAQISRELDAMLKNDGFEHISEAIGADLKK
ncbi:MULTISPECIES: dihydroorotate dehydrogenase (quinone) [unclassified Helicobacter]|uniref:dihydroorotate dehydrogenase (quinone) n=1 Tax=unclassified Helicobacter TaxID=2593540 RepID=UPI0009EF3FBE|nr:MULTISPECIES: dihydroorotate dehydrogenase (quinone) [unclassified Helicobacter]